MTEIAEKAKEMQELAMKLKAEEQEVRIDIDATREYMEKLGHDIIVLRTKLESIEELEKEINNLKVEIAEKKNKNVAYLKASSRLEEAIAQVEYISELGKRDIEKMMQKVDRKNKK